MTLEEITRLYAGYPNNSIKVANEVAEKIFNSVTSSDLDGLFIPLSGTGVNTVYGPIKVRQGGAVDFYNAAGNAAKVGFTWNGEVMYILGLEALQALRITNFSDVIIEGSAVRLGQNGANLGFFGAQVPQQTVSSQVTSTPTDLASAITSINQLNTIVNSLRTCLLTNGLLQVP